MSRDRTKMFRSKHFKVVYDAIFRGDLPEDAVSWPIVEAKRISGIIGSGESAQFGASFSVVVDGKRVAYSKRSTYAHTIDVHSLGLPGELVPVGSFRGGELYVLRPK